MICEAFEDILKGVEFKGSEAALCEFDGLELVSCGGMLEG